MEGDAKLESLEITGPAIFDKHIADVTLLPKLEFLGLCDIHPVGNTAVHLSRLVKCLAAAGPRISFMFDGVPVMLNQVLLTIDCTSSAAHSSRTVF